jgi:hypothetical protein
MSDVIQEIDARKVRALEDQIGELVSFPAEKRAQLMLHEQDPGDVDPVFARVRPATLSDFISAIREYGAEDRETIARGICPELARRLDEAAGAIEAVIETQGAARMAIDRARQFRAKYPAEFGG